MPRNVRQIKADLRALGFHNRGDDCSHTNWIHPLLPNTRITIAGNDGDDCRHYNESDLRKARRELAALRQREDY
jgi:hypothetical protein